MTDLLALSKPFPARFINQNPNGFGSYVAHHIVNQRLLQVVGPFDFQYVETIRGDVAPVDHTDPKKRKPALTNVVVGVIARLRLVIDGRVHVVEETGDCENPHNWPHDGARMKDAFSDAFKRCAMRQGLGLHLWSQGDYYLYDRLSEMAAEQSAAGGDNLQRSDQDGTPDAELASPAVGTKAP